MLYWIYDVHPLGVVGAFAASFVAVCWAAIVLPRPVVQSRFHREPGLNELVGDFLQYFGVSATAKVDVPMRSRVAISVDLRPMRSP